MWTQLERPLGTMLSRQLRTKSTIPHDIIRAELTLLLVEALYKLHSQPQGWISRQAFEVHLDPSMSPEILALGITL